MAMVWFVRHRRVAVAAAIAVLAVPAFLIWEARHAIRQARDLTESASSIGATIRPLDRPLPADVETIGAPSVFRDAALFHGHVFTAGPQGLVEYDAKGDVVRRFRIGLELPSSPLVGLTVGVLAAASEPELLIATAGEGLLTFDGRRILHVRPDRPDERKLTAVLALTSGRLLLGTGTLGVLAFDGRRLTPAHPELADVAVTALAGADADVWVGTLDRGVWHWRAGGVDRFDESGGLPDPRVLSIAIDGDRTYVGTALGVAEFEGGRYARTLGPGLFAQAVAVRHDTLLVATLDGTLAAIPLGTRSSRGARPILHDAPAPIQRFVDAGGTLYALAEDALYAVDDRTRGLRRVAGAEPGRLTDRNVSALALDTAGRLWVGYFDRGLDILGAQGERAMHVENDQVFCVNRIVHDQAGGVTAVATANGLVLFDSSGRPKQVLGRAEGLIANHVTDLVLNAGGMTIATPAGLTFVDPEGSRSLYAFHGLVNNHVYALGTAGTEVFAGTLGGVSLLDNGIIRASYTTANSALTHNWITAVARVGDEWFVGTYGGGLFRLDGKGRWQRFTDLTGPIEINPNAMAVTDTHVFAGTLSRGLLAFDRRAGRWTTIESGLPSMNVTALAADRRPSLRRHRQRPRAYPAMSRLLRFALVAALLAPIPLLGDVGVLIPSGKSAPDPAILSLDQMAIDIRIDNGDARVSIRQIFASHLGGVLEGEYLFSMPSRATVSDFAVWDGVTRIPGVILERRRAEEIYERLMQQQIDPGLLQQGERGTEGAAEATRTSAFSARIVPIPGYGTKRLEMDTTRSCRSTISDRPSRCRSVPRRTTRSRRASSPSRSAWSPPTRSRIFASAAARTRCRCASRRRTASPARSAVETSRSRKTLPSSIRSIPAGPTRSKS